MIYEYRVYQAVPRQLKTLTKVIEIAVPFFQKHGMKVLGVWTTHLTISENSNQLIYMVAFDDMAHLEKAWEAFRSDPEWLAALKKVTGTGPMSNYLDHFSNYVMTPTDYSPSE